MPDYKTLPDKDLISFLRDGDHAAFAEIYQRYFGVLYVFVFKRLKNEDNSKDLLQELFKNLWINKESLDPSGSLSGYLYRSTRNSIINFIKRGDLKKRYLISIQHSIGNQESTSSDYLIREKQLAEKIEKEVDALPEKLKKVFLLSRKEHLTYDEISEKLGIPKLSVKTYGKNALKILRLRLDSFVLLLLVLLLFH